MTWARESWNGGEEDDSSELGMGVNVGLMIGFCDLALKAFEDGLGRDVCQ